MLLRDKKYLFVTKSRARFLVYDIILPNKKQISQVFIDLLMIWAQFSIGVRLTPRWSVVNIFQRVQTKG